MKNKKKYRIYGMIIIACILVLGGGIALYQQQRSSDGPDKVLSLGSEAVQLNLDQSYSGFEGWGTSLVWWAHALGGWKDKEKENQVMDLIFDLDKGLGLNIVRYNIGGGENPNIPSTLRPGGDVPGFEPEEGHWDWNADENQRSVLQGALKRGVTIAEAFSNSPPYWMTVSGSVTGAVDGGNNLRDDQYDNFADYLTEVVKQYKDKWGITFKTLNPLNEPVSEWWKKGNIQEGAHFSFDKQAEIIQKVAASLQKKGLTETTVSAPDENSIDETLEALTTYDKAALDSISQINTHSYNGSQMAELRDFAKENGKKLWMSEYGTGGSADHNHQDMTSVMELAERIMFDLRVMQPAAWVYWQAVEDEGAQNNWGFIHANFKGEENYEMTKQYYAMGNFSKFIRPGATIIPTSDGHSIAAYDASSQKLTVVIRNDGSEHQVAIDLSGFDVKENKGKVYQTSADRNLEALDDVELYKNGFEISVPADSVTTVVISNVVLVSVK
jgi:O-glycosyl hydrolase